MKREELLRYCDNLGQVAGIDKVVYTEGKSKGVNAYQVKTGSGFCFTSLPDKCLDVSQASYKGMNLSFLSFVKGFTNSVRPKSSSQVCPA